MKFKYNSPVVLTYALICTAVYFINASVGEQFTPLVSLSPVFDTSKVLDYLTLITYILGHSSVEHLVGNLAFILLLGPVLEEKYGAANLLMMIIFTAIITGVLNLIFFNTGIIGASGIVFMFIILISFTNVNRGTIPLTFILILVIFVGREVLNSFQSNNISEFGHIAGGIIGSLFGFLINKGNKDKTSVSEHEIGNIGRESQIS